MPYPKARMVTEKAHVVSVKITLSLRSRKLFLGRKLQTVGFFDWRQSLI